MKRHLIIGWVALAAVTLWATSAPACNYSAGFSYGYASPVYAAPIVQQYAAPVCQQQYVAPQVQYQQQVYQQPLVQKQYVAQAQTYAYAAPQYVAPVQAYYQPQFVKSYAVPFRSHYVAPFRQQVFYGNRDFIGHNRAFVGVAPYRAGIATRAVYGAGNLVRGILGH